MTPVTGWGGFWPSSSPSFSCQNLFLGARCHSYTLQLKVCVRPWVTYCRHAGFSLKNKSTKFYGGCIDITIFMDHEDSPQVVRSWPYHHHTSFTATELKSACSALLPAIYLHSHSARHWREDISTFWKSWGELYTSPFLTLVLCVPTPWTPQSPLVLSSMVQDRHRQGSTRVSPSTKPTFVLICSCKDIH